MPPTPPVILSIAGFDPSSGAGVTADIKAAAAHGCYGIACITALTVQSTRGVRRVQPVSPKLMAETLKEVTSDIEVAAVRIGMIGAASIAEEIVRFLKERKPPNVVLDPVLKSTSGADLIDPEGIRVLSGQLFRLATVITPNVHEASVLTGMSVSTPDEMKAAARKLHAMGAKAVTITGGDLEITRDLLSSDGGGDDQQEFFSYERLQSQSTHGTGCAFATAVACRLALGSSLRDAVVQAKAYVTAAIRQAYPVGKGIGPVNHLYELKSRGKEQA